MRKNFNIWIVPLVPFVFFVFIALFVCHVSQVTAFDISVIKFLQKNFSFIGINFADRLSLFHHNYAVIIVLFATFFLVNKKNYALAIMYFLCDYSCRNLVSFVKNIFQRHRPPIELQPLYHPDDFSFPSGHSYAIMLLLGLLIYIIFKYIENKFLKYTLSGICTLMIILVGLSRLLLGVHYPTDVLAGFLLGLSVIGCVWIVTKDRD